MGQSDGGEVKAEKKKAMDPDKPKRLLSSSDWYSIKKKDELKRELPSLLSPTYNGLDLPSFAENLASVLPFKTSPSLAPALSLI